MKSFRKFQAYILNLRRYNILYEIILYQIVVRITHIFDNLMEYKINVHNDFSIHFFGVEYIYQFSLLLYLEGYDGKKRFENSNTIIHLPHVP